MRGTEWVLLAACAVLVLAGPTMALQEFTAGERAASLAELTGEPQPLEVAFRAAWRVVLFLVVLLVGIVGTLLALRVAWQPRVRGVSGRLLALLLGGMTLLDLAFLADARFFAEVPYALRAVSIVWAYPIAGVLVAGSVLRLAELERAFGGPKTS